LEDESDDEARHCCFSPMASVDALDGEIDPDDDYDDDDNNNSDSDELETVGSYDGQPLQLAIDTNRGVMTVSDNNIVGTDLSLVATQLDLDVQEGTVTKAVDESGETVSKAASMKAKASSVFSAKAQKAKQKTLDVIAPTITLMATRKSEQRINDELSAASSKAS